MLNEKTRELYFEIMKLYKGLDDIYMREPIKDEIDKHNSENKYDTLRLVGDNLPFHVTAFLASFVGIPRTTIDQAFRYGKE